MAATTEDMASAVAGLVEAGFHSSLERDDKTRDEVRIYERLRWTLTREAVHIELEALEYPDGTAAFYLALIDYHGLSTSSFPLDSWKLWPERIEFKFYTHPESGQGLTFTIKLV